MHVDIAVEIPVAWWQCTSKRFPDGEVMSYRIIHGLLEGGPFDKKNRKTALESSEKYVFVFFTAAIILLILVLIYNDIPLLPTEQGIRQ